MFFSNQLKNNILNYALTLLALLYFSCHSAFANNNYTIPDEDVFELKQLIFNPKEKLRKEAILEIKWAGISDPRVFDPIMEKIQSKEKLKKRFLFSYVEAIICSGNEKYIPILESILADKKQSNNIKYAIKRYLPEFEKHKKNSNFMNSNDNQYSNRIEFWEKRYRKGLNADDSSIIQLAARDLYMRGFDAKYYDLAEEYIIQHYQTKLDDGYIIDALSYLCKSLRLSKNQKYQNLFVTVANNTPNKKLAKYAEDSARYNAPSFVSSNPVLYSN